jgi:hypothetical protein
VERGRAGGRSRDRTRHYPLIKNPHKMEEILFVS